MACENEQAELVAAQADVYVNQGSQAVLTGQISMYNTQIDMATMNKNAAQQQLLQLQAALPGLQQTLTEKQRAYDNCIAGQ